jgi:hypothetical protein
VTCDRIRKHLTGYLDGEVDSDLGSVIRGHLRSCPTCRGLANDEAMLRDGLRVLPQVDAPASLWAGVQARLAQEEVADSKRPTWRRVVSRWMPSFTPSRLATGSLALVAAISLVWWKTRPVDDELPTVAQGIHINLETPELPTVAASSDDVSDDLAKDALRETQGWQREVEDLTDAAKTTRQHWSADDKTAFDTRIAKMRAAIAASPEGPERQQRWRDLAKYLQGAVTRDQLASRDKTMAGGAR